ncbi:10573_t:CDS:2 [Racocetra fulgida]|uniref:10573_t:CDS:1 n=1 Tax=Racocetra fulgida TaxID=60492 RepID=A0A9N8Z9M3_9GLOM|nr:10573_t:CDS:2 [Racocetra fulgida]
MRPKLDRDALQWTIELIEELESYWSRVGIIIDENDVNIIDKNDVNKPSIENNDLPKWMRRFTYDMIYRIAIGIKGNALNSYTNNLCNVDNQETESTSIINSIQTYIDGIPYFRLFPKYALYYLAHHPHVLTRFRQELDSIFQDDMSRKITLKDLNNLKYCESIIKEVFRIQPVLSTNVRLNSERDEICGYIWPANTDFMLFYGAMAKRPEAWNEPLKFNPDRFYNYLTNEEHVL